MFGPVDDKTLNTLMSGGVTAEGTIKALPSGLRERYALLRCCPYKLHKLPLLQIQLRKKPHINKQLQMVIPGHGFGARLLLFASSVDSDPNPAADTNPAGCADFVS
ncbi:hypothetical protein ACFX13_013159 [Malus domestica]